MFFFVSGELSSRPTIHEPWVIIILLVESLMCRQNSPCNRCTGGHSRIRRIHTLRLRWRGSLLFHHPEKQEAAVGSIPLHWRSSLANYRSILACTWAVMHWHTTRGNLPPISGTRITSSNRIHYLWRIEARPFRELRTKKVNNWPSPKMVYPELCLVINC